MNLKTIAFYLPQFHRTPENDEWWEEGYTEWTAVKAAEKLYEGHNQPRVPLNQNYYNLLEYDTMVWQSELMKKYHVDGLCMYHYWFENGRKVLEKPAENLLRWTDIDMPFCFCWANETWARTWSKIVDANTWTGTYEPGKGTEDKAVLLKQCYGREKDWEEHFQYLLTFFKDDRYIKLDGKPIFLIYRPRIIPSLWNMMQYFQRRAKESSLPGIYVIGMEIDQLPGTDAALIRQPYYAITDLIQKNHLIEHPIRCSYDEIWNEILKKNLRSEKTYLCGTVDYDDTPRHGSRTGRLLEGASPKKFYKYFKRLYQKNLLLNNEYIFLNAWNEWGESMYLEPDEENGYGYLEAVRRVVEECREEKWSKREETREEFYETESERTLAEKEERIQILWAHDKLLNDWMYLRDHTINVSSYFHKYGYQNIAIYGMGKLGEHLLCELKEGGIYVSFGIDKNGGENRQSIGIEIYRPEQKMPKTDAVVITVTDQYAEISRMLSREMECPMITIEEIIQEVILEQQ